MPILFDDGAPLDVNIHIDECIRNSKIIQVTSQTHMMIDGIEYVIDHSGDVLDTVVPPLKCICVLPPLTGLITLQVSLGT